MKRWLFVTLAAISVLSCSKVGNEPVEPEPEPQILPEVKITTTDNGKNIFEVMEFWIYIEGADSKTRLFEGVNLSDYYDRLVWNIPALDASFQFFESGHAYSKFIHQWGNCFYRPGTWDTILLGYKSGEVIYSYKFPVTVNGNIGDFLDYDWADVTEDSGGSIGYANVFEDNNGWYFSVSKSMRGETPSLTLYCSTTAENTLSEKKERELLFDQICSLYGEPAYGEDDPETEANYNELFHYREEETYPECIWITDSSKIVLIRDTGEFPIWLYRIYAEPLNS